MTWSPRSKNAWHFGKNVPHLCSDSPTANAPSPLWIWANYQSPSCQDAEDGDQEKNESAPSGGKKRKLILDKSKVSTNWHVLPHVLTGAALRGWGPRSQEALVQGGNQWSCHEVSLEMHDGKVKGETAYAETQETMWWVGIRTHSSLLSLTNLQCWREAWWNVQPTNGC